MAKVHVCNVVVLDNPSQFNNPFQFEITFECIEDLPEDLEWKIIYVGSAESEEFDQVLDTVYVGPVPEGRHMFVFQVKFLDSISRAVFYRKLFVSQANPPNPEKIPVADLVGVTVVLLTCSYRSAGESGIGDRRMMHFLHMFYSSEFIRIGYYVSNDYLDPELKETNPSPPQWDKLQRNILATNPR